MDIHPLDKWLAHKARILECDTVVLHATAGPTASGAIQTLRQKKLSYHYLLEDQREHDGRIIKCVPSRSVAFHAGESRGPHGRWVNNYSLGISFVNDNLGHDPYSQKQFDACAELIEALKGDFPLKWLTTHYWISPGRKSDPKGFDIEGMGRRVGLALWKG